MTNNKNLIIGIIAVIALLLAGAAYFRAPITTVVERTVGAVVGPELMSPFWTVNGVKTEYRTCRMVASTSCAILLPVGTSTIASYSLNVTAGPSADVEMDIGTSTTPWATTTKPMIAKGLLLVASAQKTFIWNAATTTTIALAPYDIFGNSTNVVTATTSGPANNVDKYGSYLIFRIGTAPAIYASGTVSVMFRSVQ